MSSFKNQDILQRQLLWLAYRHHILAYHQVLGDLKSPDVKLFFILKGRSPRKVDEQVYILLEPISPLSPVLEIQLSWQQKRKVETVVFPYLESWFCSAYLPKEKNPSVARFKNPSLLARKTARSAVFRAKLGVWWRSLQRVHCAVTESPQQVPGAEPLVRG